LVQFSARAQRQVRALFRHYEQPERPEAAAALVNSLEAAVASIAANPAAGLPAPRPYPELAAHNRLWLKTGRYWVAYSLTQPPIILGVFYDAADIPGRA
jgi:plasmid stabilization system protein ParE